MGPFFYTSFCLLPAVPTVHAKKVFWKMGLIMRRFLCFMMLICLLMAASVTASVAASGTASAAASVTASVTASAATTLQEDAKIQRQVDNITIDIIYPVLDQLQIRADVQHWVNLLAENFWLEYRDDAKATTTPFELLVSYTLSWPSANILSIAWEVSSYTGGAHGNREIVTMTYDLQTGTLLDPLAFFADPNAALKAMSVYSRASLSNTLGSMLVERMLHAGTEPSLENFSAITLTPSGVRVYFQPYQIAPWASGSQIVDVPLSDLQEAGPDTAIWGN